jgi:hypothetical protein
MIISALIASTVFLGVQDKPVMLNRVFKKGEKATYKVLSSLQIEARGGELLTFMPEDVDLNYNFTYEITAMKADGIAVMRYKRPTMTEIRGETATSPPRSTTIKSNLDWQLSVSPINEILETKDLYKKPDPKKKKGGGKASWMTFDGPSVTMQDPTGFIQEIYRLALFAGSVDSALDFSPKLPYDETKIGDTWQRTVGYSPQKLKNAKSGKSAVQRLDYTFTYKGVQNYNGKPYHRISGVLKLDTDLAPWLHEVTGLKPDETMLHAFKLQFNATVDFDLDINTRRTVRAEANSTGGMQVFLTMNKEAAFQEQRIKGHTTMSALSVKP